MLPQIVAAVAGGIVSSLVAGVVSYRQGRARARDEAIEKLEERLRKVELRSVSTRAAFRVERRKQQRRNDHERED